MVLVSSMILSLTLFFFFFFNDTATTEIYTLSLHDALPISLIHEAGLQRHVGDGDMCCQQALRPGDAHLCLIGMRRKADRDRKSTRLNSSHANISYAVFCLKKKKNT